MTISASIRWVAILALLVGCRMRAPIHVWETPDGPTLNANMFAIGALNGDPKTATRLEQALLSNIPIVRPDLTIVSHQQLTQFSPIRLVSTAPSHSDLSLYSAARNAGIRYMISGDVISDELTLPDAQPALPIDYQNLDKKIAEAIAPANLRRPERLSVVWKLHDIATGEMIASKTISYSRTEAEQYYPDLQWVTDGGDKVTAAVARQAWDMVTPHVEKDSIAISLPWLLPGSAEVRKGNAYAIQNRWDLAEQTWVDVAEKQAWNLAAWHNAAIAAAAREDFATAKQRIKHVLERRSNKLHETTFAWIEQKQRDYHTAFLLPDPPDGWAFPSPVRTAFSQAGQDANLTGVVGSGNENFPISDKDMPWWTAIPFTKPPGWTWKAWLTQPFPL